MQDEGALDKFLAKFPEEQPQEGSLDSFLREFEPTAGERAHGFAAGVGSGVLEGAVGGTLKGAGILTGIDALQGAGEAVTRFGESLHPDNPLARETLTTKAGEAIGQGLGFMAPGGVAGKALKLGSKGMAGIVATQGALSNGASGYYDALAHGASEGEAMESFLLNGGVGLSEAVPLAQILTRVKRAAGPSWSQAVRLALVEGAEEGSQEMAQQALGNVIARELYDEEREILSGVVEGGGLGAFAGVVLSALGSGVSRVMPSPPAPPPPGSVLGDLGGDPVQGPTRPPSAAELMALDLYREGPNAAGAEFVAPRSPVQERVVEELGAIGVEARFASNGPNGMSAPGVMIFNGNIADDFLTQSVVLHEVSHEVRDRLAEELRGGLREDLGPWQELYSAIEKLDPKGLAATVEVLESRGYADATDPDELLANYLEDRGGFFFSEKFDEVIANPSIGRRILEAIKGMLKRLGLPVSTGLEHGYSKDSAVEIKSAIEQMAAVLRRETKAAETAQVVEAEVSAPVETELDIILKAGKTKVPEAEDSKTKRQKANKRKKREAKGGEYGLQAFVAAHGGLERNAETERYVSRERDGNTQFGPITRSKKGGRSIDDMAEIAWEEGLFNERPSEAEFLEALDNDFNPKDYDVPFSRSKQPKEDMREELKRKRAEFQEAKKRVEEKGEEPTVERVNEERKGRDVPYFRSTDSATDIFGVPDKDSPYDRGFEPSGEYFTPTEGRVGDNLDPVTGLESGVHRFKNPLVIEAGSYGKPSSWKRVLSERYGGLTGRDLSRAIIEDGYDGILTTDHGHLSEGVNLQTFRFDDAKFSRSQTESKPFRKWFGDSKVVDENGTPRIVMHGSPDARHTVFDLAKTGTASDDGWFGEGFYFTGSPYVAGDYAYGAWSSDPVVAGAIYPAYLSIQKPFHWRTDSDKEIRQTEGRARQLGFSIMAGTIHAGEAKASPKDVRKKLEAAGYDGIIVNEGANTAEYVVFRSEQIKSAIGNRGTFDANNPDIRYSLSPKYFSKLEREVEKRSGKLTRGQLIKLVGKDEWEWSTLDTLFEGRGAVPQAEVLEYLKASNVEVGEVLLGAPVGNDSDPSAPRHPDYQLPGGENYRELLVTLPEKNQQGLQAFTSSHYDTPNILTHLRFNERGDTLFLEEIQSDWHQEGRKKGYDTPLPAAQSADGWTAAYGLGRWEVKDANGNDVDSVRGQDADTAEEAIAIASRSWLAQPSVDFRDAVPNAPFQKDLACPRLETCDPLGGRQRLREAGVDYGRAAGCALRGRDPRGGG